MPRSTGVLVVLILCLLLIVIGMWMMTESSPAPNYSVTTHSTYTPTTDVAPPPATPAPPPTIAPPSSAQMLLGNPSNATADPDNRDNYLMVKPYFALAYNNSAGEPRWVSWRVCSVARPPLLLDPLDRQ